LTYLTKSSGPLLLGAWGVTALLHYRKQIGQRLELLLVPLFFLLTTFPLLVYNTRVFGSPFYNLDSAHVLWMDSWDESQVANPSDLPTLATYLQTHSVAAIVTRFQVGFARLTDFLPQVLIPSRTLEPSWLGPVLAGGALVTVGVLLAWRRDWILGYYRCHRLTLSFSLFLFAIFYVFSAWYAYIQVESRFYIPLLGPLYLLLADGFISLVRRVGRWAWTHRELNPPAMVIRSNLFRWAYLGGVAALLVWGASWLIRTTQADAWSLNVNPFVSDQEANVAPETVLSWLVHDHPKEAGEARVIFGPSKSLPIWKFPSYFTFKRIPIDVDTWDALQRYFHESASHYIIIDHDTVRRRPALSEYFTLDGDGVAFQRIPEGWILTYLYDSSPHTWSIFTPFALPSVPVSANFGEQIELLGYDLKPYSEDEPALYVTLDWRAVSTLTEDYTIFLHLTAPDGFVKAQQDQQPLAGLWPTSRWTQGDVVADHYRIPMHQGVQPGEYLLITGLYTPQTGQRMPLVDGPRAPSPNAVLLGKINLPTSH
jgi:hypothetical protein